MEKLYTFKRMLFAVILMMMSALSWAYDFEVDGIYYKVNKDRASVSVTYQNNYYPYYDSGNKPSGDIVIPSAVSYNDVEYSVTGIKDYAFIYCYDLTSIFLPESVTSIGIGAFSYCFSLASITVAANNPAYDSREGCNAIIETASNTLIWGCHRTIIPESVTSIGDYAFNASSFLISLSIPESVTSIGKDAFSYCESLTFISIPEGVTSIGDYAFEGCSSLTSVVCYAEKVPYLGIYVFSSVPTGKAALYVPESALEGYKAATQWNSFRIILPLEEIPLGISNIEADDSNAPYYTLDGKRVDNPTQKGIYIRNGKKVMIK